jgi:hypothetical protein
VAAADDDDDDEGEEDAKDIGGRLDDRFETLKYASLESWLTLMVRLRNIGMMAAAAEFTPRNFLFPEVDDSSDWDLKTGEGSGTDPNTEPRDNRGGGMAGEEAGNEDEEGAVDEVGAVEAAFDAG